MNEENEVLDENLDQEEQESEDQETLDQEKQEEQDSEGQEEQEGEEEPPQDTVPLKTYLEVKKANKEIKKRLESLENIKYSQDILDYKKKVKNSYLEKGYEEGFADLQAEHLAEIREAMANKGKKSFEDTISDDIDDLAETDEFYSNAINYKYEIAEKVRSFRKKGVDLSVEDAYAMVSNVKRRSKEVKQNAAQRDKLRSSQQGVANKRTSSNSAPIKTKFKLSATDRKALKGLQSMQPDAGWNEEKFIKIMK